MMESYLVNTAYVVGEYTKNGQTKTISAKSNQSIVRVIDTCCLNNRCCPQVPIYMEEKLDLKPCQDRYYQLSKNIQVPCFREACDVYLKRYCLKWCVNEKRTLLHIHLRYTLKYYDTKGKVRRYYGILSRCISRGIYQWNRCYIPQIIK